MTFDATDSNAIVIMYPTGGYGNFLHRLLGHHLANTVKLAENFDFSNTGDSHAVTKHVEPFRLGHQKSKLVYSYKINPAAYEQIQQNKKFLILGDMGNLGDNISFLKRYFANATIVRIYAESFDEKLVIWANCMFKAYDNEHDPLYPGALHTIKGIQTWAQRQDISDQDAVDCMVNFFKKDFYPYGQFFAKAVPGVINLAVKEFMSEHAIVNMMQRLAKELNTTVLYEPELRLTAQRFVGLQKSFTLLADCATQFPLIARALYACKK